MRDIVGESLDQASQSRNSTWRYQPIDQAERQQFSQHGQEVYRFRDQRQQWETSTATDPSADAAPHGGPARMRFPSSPIVARSADQLGKGHAPPRMYEAPKPDPNVAAKPRGDRLPGQPQRHTVGRMPLDQPRTQPQAAPEVEPPAPRTPRQPQAKGAPQLRGNSARPNQDILKKKPKKKPEDSSKNHPKGKDK